MARRAEWRRAKDDPKTALGLMRNAFRGFSSLTLCFCLAVALSGAVWSFHATPRVLVVFALLPFALLFSYPPRGASESVATLPLPEETYLVRVAVLSGGIVTGYDDAIASFVDGWLHVEGVRASFSLRATDVRTRHAELSPTLRIDLGDGAEVRVELVAPRARIGERSSARAFSDSAHRWTRDAVRATGEPVLPPTVPQPAVAARTAVRAALLLTVVLCIETALFMDPSSGIIPFRTRPLPALAYLYLFGPSLLTLAWSVRAFSAFRRRTPASESAKASQDPAREPSATVIP